ncbi:MAG: transketolase, partial [bacterium]
MNNKISEDKILFLKNRALNLAIDSIRSTTQAGSGHPTSCLSAADLISVIFFNELKYDLKNPKNPNNDRFILSKGHAAPVLYAAWKQLGVISDEELMSLRKFDSVLEGHPTRRFEYNEAATGSLGQGLAIGVGMAMNAKMDKLDYTTYVFMGDGEIAEGSVWEAASLASHYKLDNLIGIIDCNKLGQTGSTLHADNEEEYAKKFEAFGWQSFVIGGHDTEQILKTYKKIDILRKQGESRPFVIIAKTHKGFGLTSVQDKNGFHGKPFSKNEVEKLITQLKDKFPEAALFKTEKKYVPASPKKVKDKKHEKVSLDLQKDRNSSLFDIGQQMATRKAFGYALTAIGKIEQDLVVLDGDVKNSTFTEIFEEVFPDRFIQCFIAEQAMIGIATGFDARGKISFSATFAAFLTRAFDQLRMAAIGKNSLRLCGSHVGVSIGQDGPSQMGLEDIAMFRTLPNSVILYPCDGVSAYKLVEQMANYHDGISYIRTTRPKTPVIYDKDEKFEIGGCKVLSKNNNDKVCLIGAGITLHEIMKSYEKLKDKTINVSMIDLYSIKPLDVETISRIAKESNNKIITVEDHYLDGGLGQAVSSALINEDIKVYN